MNIVKKLTLSHLKENKMRTIITTLGICVSVAMITAVVVAATSFLNMFGETVLTNGGNYHFYIATTEQQIKDFIESDSRVDSVGRRYMPDGKAAGYTLDYGKSKHTSTGTWYIGDKQNLSQMITSDYDGRLPENSHEILVEQKYIEANELDWKIGDTVSVTSGGRFIGEPYFFKLYVNGSYRFDEHFEKSGTDKYKIVGILHNNLPTQSDGNSLIRGADDTVGKTIRAYVQMKKITPLSIREIKEITDRYHYDKDEAVFNIGVNELYLQTKLAIGESVDLMAVLLPACAVILLIIIIASAILIYNAFNMSFDERVRYLGMLTSVGATKKQKCASVYFEAALLGAIGIPLGMLTGVSIIGITLALIGDRIASSEIVSLSGITNATSLHLYVPPLALVGIFLLGVVTLIIASYIPARRASQITPIDAIRQSDSIRLYGKIRTPWLVRHIFGYEGELAHKNLRRNRSKAFMIVGSIVLSVVLFLGCNYFCDVFVRSTEVNIESNYQVEASVGTEHGFDKLVQKLSEMDGVEHFFHKNMVNFSSHHDDRENQYRELVEEVFNENTLTPKYKYLAESDPSITFIAIDDKDFNTLCKNNGIDYKPYYKLDTKNKLIKSVIINDITGGESKTPVFNENVIGQRAGTYWADLADVYEDYIAYPENYSAEEAEYIERIHADGGDYSYIIGDIAQYDPDNYIFGISPGGVTAFCPFSVFDKMSFDENNTGDYDFGIVTADHARVTEELNEFFEDNGYSGNIMDIEYYREKAFSTVLVLKVFIYGFVILISLITLFNIINTISTGIALRKKEFAMLKSVGITPKGLRKMVMLESAFYGIRALFIALPLSIGVSYLINRIVSMNSIPFELNIPLYLAVIFVTFAVTGLTMLYSVHSLRTDSIIEALKEDIT